MPQAHSTDYRIVYHKSRKNPSNNSHVLLRHCELSSVSLFSRPDERDRVADRSECAHKSWSWGSILNEYRCWLKAGSAVSAPLMIMQFAARSWERVNSRLTYCWFLPYCKSRTSSSSSRQPYCSSLHDQRRCFTRICNVVDIPSTLNLSTFSIFQLFFHEMQ